MTPITHNYSHLAGQTVDWDTSDSQAWFMKNLRDDFAKQRLIDLGYIDNPISYQFNQHGFRCAEFDRKYDVVCFGCSFTMGTGVHSDQTWPAQLEKSTGLRVANLGHAGSSNDTAFRYATYYLELLRPAYAIWLQTDSHRIELLDDGRKINLNLISTDSNSPCANDYFVKVWLSSSSNHEINLKKNTWAFEHLCQKWNIKPLILTRDFVPMHPPYPYGQARDLTHPGADTYSELAQKIKLLLEPTHK